MAARDVLKNINLFVDGRGYAGQVDAFTPPKMTLKTEEYRAGGMDASLKITMGMEALDGEFTLKGYDADVLALFGLREGNLVPLTLLEALESFDGTITQVKHNVRAKITEIDGGERKPGELPSLKISYNAAYYKQVHGGRLIHEIDVERMIRTINGVDQLSGQRAALNM